MSTIPLSTHSSCLPVASGNGDFCYRATLLHGDTVIDSITNLNFGICSIADLQTFLGAGVSYQLDRVESGGSVSHLTTATLSYGSVAQEVSGTSPLLALTECETMQKRGHSQVSINVANLPV